jgi:hypothetical protein
LPQVPDDFASLSSIGRAGEWFQNGTRNGTRAGRETPLLPATGCEQPQRATKNADDPKSKESHALDTLVPHDATGCEKRRRRDSNPGWRICNQTSNPQNAEENTHSSKGAAQGAAVGAENAPIDADLARVVEAWPSLPAALRAAVLAIIDAADKTAAD